VLEHVERILAIELLVAAQALDLRRDSLADGDGAPEPGRGVRAAHVRLRARVARLAVDREPGPDLAAATDLVRSGVLAELVTPGAGVH
jgi:histidine ammonia-lyase